MKQYLSIVEDILDNGHFKNSRAGKVLSKYGYMKRYDLNKAFPLVTTKRMWFNGIVDELLWMISGSTNVNDLSENVQKIWEPWADENGELGPVYGKQLREWSGHYDQLKEVIKGLKENPKSRRHVISLWNAPKIEYQALPPCHLVTTQFTCNHTRYGTYLNMGMYQRSADVALGLPWNIAFHALFLHMVANVCDYNPGTFTHFVGDAHIYLNHREGLKKQIEREPLEKPQVEVANKDSIDDYEKDDFELKDYKHHPKISFEINV